MKDEDRRVLLTLERIAKASEDQNRLSAKFYNDQREYMELQSKWTNLLLKINDVK